MQDINNLTTAIVEAIQDKKGSGICVLDLSRLESAPAPELIVCQGKSTSQVSAIADNIRDHVQSATGNKPYHHEGYRNSQWIIIDYGNIMVHVFLPDTRTFYGLEDLWSDADIKEIEDLD